MDAVIFDWGGTLTPWHELDLLDSWRAYAGVYDPPNAELLAAALHRSEEDAWRSARERQVSAALDDVFRRGGVLTEGDRHRSALAAYAAFWAPHSVTDSAAPALLAGLRERGMRVGVLSNTLWSRDQHEHVFRRDGVLDLIDGAVYTSEIAWTKPHPEAFRAALAAVGVTDPARVVFVGDRLYDDIYGAQRLGMRTIHLPNSTIPADQRGPVAGRPDATVAGLVEILPLIDQWAR